MLSFPMFYINFVFRVLVMFLTGLKKPFISHYAVNYQAADNIIKVMFVSSF